MTCIVCPMSCGLELDVADGRITEVRGNTCPRGRQYASQEFSNPTRSITSTVKVLGGVLPRLPVHTCGEVPRSKVQTCMDALKAVEVKAPVELGQVVLADIAGTGVDVVSSRSMPERTSTRG